MARSILRFAPAQLTALGSDDRRALDLLLNVEDMPEPGWRLRRQRRVRVGFQRSDEEWAKRARKSKAVGAFRVLASSETDCQFVTQAVPFPNEADARSALAVVLEERFPHMDFTAQSRDEAVLEPPAAAGEHARALMIGTTSRGGTFRTLVVAWADLGGMLLALTLHAPAHVELWDQMSLLVLCQRDRLAQAAPWAGSSPRWGDTRVR